MCFFFVPISFVPEIAMNTPKILLLIDNRSSRLLLADYLDPFELVALSPQDMDFTGVATEFDLVILDLETLMRHHNELAAWRASAAPLLLPTLVSIQPDAIVSLTTEILKQIDALVVEPISAVELGISTATLLKTRQLSHELHRKAEELAEAKELKSQFISAIAHELRNPLSIIAGIAQLLQKGGKTLTADKRQAMLERIQLAVERITQMINGLLTFNRNTSGQAEFNPEQVDLEAHCRGIVNDFRLINVGANEISLCTEGDLAELWIDTDLIGTILSNLLSNALKYSPEGSPVLLQLTRQEKQVILEVIDAGQGIPEADQSALFDAFFRAGNVGPIKGAGLGLSIVKQCVELHRGTIEVQSQVGHGTNFVVTLPSEPVEAVSDRPLYPDPVRIISTINRVKANATSDLSLDSSVNE